MQAVCNDHFFPVTQELVLLVLLRLLVPLVLLVLLRLRLLVLGRRPNRGAGKQVRVSLPS